MGYIAVAQLADVRQKIKKLRSLELVWCAP